MMNVVGRRLGEEERVGSEPNTPSSHPRTPMTRPRGASTVTADGVSFEMLTPSPPLDPPFVTRGARDSDSMYYDADNPSLQESELETMSFARTPEPFNFSSSGSLGAMMDPTEQSSPASLIRRDDADDTITAPNERIGRGLKFARGGIPSMVNEEDVEEVRGGEGFVQAMGIEFDEIARRAQANIL